MYQEKQWPEVGTLGYSRLDGTWGGQMVLDADAECTRIEVVLKPTRSRSIADSPELLEKHVMRHFIEGLRKIEKCSIVRDAFIHGRCNLSSELYQLVNCGAITDKAELFRDNDVVDLEIVTEFGGDNLV